MSGQGVKRVCVGESIKSCGYGYVDTWVWMCSHVGICMPVRVGASVNAYVLC